MLGLLLFVITLKQIISKLKSGRHKKRGEPETDLNDVDQRNSPAAVETPQFRHESEDHGQPLPRSEPSQQLLIEQLRNEIDNLKRALRLREIHLNDADNLRRQFEYEMYRLQHEIKELESYY